MFELEFILFWRIFLKILKPKFWQKTLCSLESIFDSFFMFIKLRIKNKQLLMNNYSCKVSQSDINDQVPLTPHSRLFNRLRWLITAVLKFIKKWNQWIKKAQDILHKVSQSKFKNIFYLLVTRFCLSWNGFCSNWFPWKLWYQKTPDFKQSWLKYVRLYLINIYIYKQGQPKEWVLSLICNIDFFWTTM